MVEKLVQVLSVSAVGIALLLSFGVVNGLAADATINAGGTTWNPSTAEVPPGGTVDFNNASGIQHALSWEGASPSGCSQIPSTLNTATASWTGTCSFAQAGEYKFVCPVHSATMKGTITVGGGGPSAPVVTAESATNVKDTEATLRASVNPKGEATTYFFQYGTTTGYGQQVPLTPGDAGNGTSNVAKSATAMGLTANTTYHFRMVATNGTGTTNGDDRSFTTGGPPIAETDPATGIGPVSATLKGIVNPKGLETKYFFEYGTTLGYGKKTEEKNAGSGTSNVTASIVATTLLPLTEYHFRLVAKNSAAGGEVKGGDLTFTTTGGPVATTGQASGVGETTATVAGVVGPQGQQTSYFFEYGTSLSYGQKTSEKGAGAGTGSFNASDQLTGLSPGTTYHFQLVAKNPGGETEGGDQTFTTEATPPPPPPPPPPPAPSLPAPDPVAPDTKITSKPPAKTRDRTPTIKFSATVGGASFQCSVDSKPFKACRSPFTAPSLKPGRHKIRVKATAGGLTDPSPASVSFKVVAKKKKK